MGPCGIELLYSIEEVDGLNYVVRHQVGLPKPLEKLIVLGSDGGHGKIGYNGATNDYVIWDIRIGSDLNISKESLSEIWEFVCVRFGGEPDCWKREMKFCELSPDPNSPASTS